LQIKRAGASKREIGPLARASTAPASGYLDVVRIWDLEPRVLCDRHLLGEHRELHAIWSILTTGKRGYANHPETIRWRGRLAALYARHESEVEEMERRGFSHRSPLDRRLATGERLQPDRVDPVDVQAARLEARDCGCLQANPTTEPAGMPERA
jgi:hypothetical protein